MLRFNHLVIAVAVIVVVAVYLTTDFRHDAFRPTVGNAEARVAAEPLAFTPAPSTPATAIARIPKLAERPVALTEVARLKQAVSLRAATVTVIEISAVAPVVPSVDRAIVEKLPIQAVMADHVIPLPVRRPDDGIVSDIGDFGILLTNPVLPDAGRRRAALRPLRSARISQKHNTGPATLPPGIRQVYRDPFSTSGQ